jgi:hypothetical protein
LNAYTAFHRLKVNEVIVRALLDWWNSLPKDEQERCDGIVKEALGSWENRTFVGGCWLTAMKPDDADEGEPALVMRNGRHE